jgi:hypothetical protein
VAIGTVTWAAAVVGTTGNLTPAQPSPAANDLLLCFCYDFAQLTSWTQPSGWSTHKNAAVASSGTYAIFYKVATGSEGTGTITCAATGTGNSRIARICKVPGAGGQSADLFTGAQEAETATPYVNAGVTPTIGNCIVFFFGGVKDCITNAETDGFGTPTGGTNLGSWNMNSIGTTGGSDAAMGIGRAMQTTAAATGNISCALQASQTTYAGISYTFAVKETSVRSGTGTSLTGTGTLGTADGTRAVSAAAPDFTGTGDLSTANGTKAVSQTVSALTGAGDYSTADGVAASGESRSGTATDLTGTGALDTAVGTKAVSQTVAALTGTAALSTGAGAKAVSATVADLAGTGAFSTAPGTKAVSATVADMAAAAALGQLFGTRAVSGTVDGLAGTGAYSTADGTAAQPEERTGTAQDMTGTGAVSTATGQKSIESTVLDLAGAGAYSTADGLAALIESRDGTGETLSGTGWYSTADGSAGAVILAIKLAVLFARRPRAAMSSVGAADPVVTVRVQRPSGTLSANREEP